MVVLSFGMFSILAGAKGQKASGMLMAGGVPYIRVRNAGNSQLAWSSDHAKTWTWSGWRFEMSFGCPTFLNLGKDYLVDPHGWRSYYPSPWRSALCAELGRATSMGKSGVLQRCACRRQSRERSSSGTPYR